MSAAASNQPDDPSRVACARCGATFACKPMGDCWCKHEPVRLPMPAAGAGCLCVDCLRKAAAGL
ncbi:MAG TPA: hypothetical protein VGG01_14870 [Xanthobacteraceae bacterium]|jgi:hypothetical protein